MYRSSTLMCCVLFFLWNAEPMEPLSGHLLRPGDMFSLFGDHRAWCSTWRFQSHQNHCCAWRFQGLFSVPLATHAENIIDTHHLLLSEFVRAFFFKQLPTCFNSHVVYLMMLDLLQLSV